MIQRTPEEEQRWNALFYPRKPGEPEDAPRVLRNKFGLDDNAELQRREYRRTEQRIDEITSVESSFEGFKKVHRHLFEDVYDWAGQVRDYNMGKRSMGGDFAHYSVIEQEGTQLFDRFNQFEKPRDIDEFGERAGSLAGGLNWLHPFREGNGRAMTTFMTHWSRQQGYSIDFNSWGAQWMETSHAAFHGDNTPMRDAIARELERDLDHGLEH